MPRFCWHCGGDADEPNHVSRCDGRQGGLDDPGLQRSPADITVDPKTNVRSTDPTTSRQAAYQHLDAKHTQRAQVYAALKNARGDGLTDDELWRVTGLDRLSSVSKRRGELRDAGLVVASGRTRKTQTGSQAIVWVLQEFAVAA